MPPKIEITFFLYNSILPLLIEFCNIVLAIYFNLFYNTRKGGIAMGGNRNLKNRTAISTAINNEIYKKAKEYSEKTSIPISKIIDKALEMYLETVDK